MNSFEASSTLTVDDREYEIFRLDALQAKFDVARLPFALKILLENLLRNEDGRTVEAADVEALANWVATDEPSREIAYSPARVLLQDFTGVPAIVDLAAMRDAMGDLGGDPARINPLQPAELVIDHSVQVDQFATSHAFQFNAEREFERNRERYAFLRWGQQAFDNFAVVPPDTGICHQVNLEYLARVVFGAESDAGGSAYPDTLVGTDSHTTMVNGLGVLGWGVGGIEAEAAMLGQPVSMLIPQVIGFKLNGELPEGATATDLVLTVTQMLREKGVVGKFVEFFGDGLAGLPLADRATISNMAPEQGATCVMFPIDARRCTTCASPGAPSSRLRWSRPMRASRACSTKPIPRRPSTPTRWSSTSETSSRASPGRGARRIACRSATHGIRSRASSSSSPAGALRTRPSTRTSSASQARAGTSPSASRSRCRTPRSRSRSTGPVLPRSRLGRDRGDHELHEHLEPGRDGGGRAAGPQGGRAGAGAGPG